jgi:ATP-binding protein involved in chromosome partitioning
MDFGGIMHNVEIDHRNSIIKERMSKIKNKIIVMSNKGGVGKSTVSVLIAQALNKKGFKVGLLDSDIHGPSIAKMTGSESMDYEANDESTLKPILKNNIKIVSMGSIMKENDKALIWRGPIKISVIKQFLADFEWGELDYLIIDLPPGTGDEPLSICQEINDINGAVIVTTAQKISMLDVSKAIDFLTKLNIKVLSIIENMSEFICPHCGKSSKLFYSKDDIYEKLKDRKIIKLPFYSEIMEKLDNGEFENIFDTRSELIEKIISSIGCDQK